MSDFIPFQVRNREQSSDLEVLIDQELQQVPRKDREKLRFELIKTIDSYDAFLPNGICPFQNRPRKPLKSRYTMWFTKNMSARYARSKIL